jgi:choline-sulfatase
MGQTGVRPLLVTMVRSPGSELPFKVAVFFALCAAACGRHSGAPAAAERPDLVLVTIDTLRADRVGRGLTPALDALAARGVRFTNARATAPLTLPSHASMLTGALPPRHGIRENGIHAFPGSPRSVARSLRERGYTTAAFVAAYVLDRRFGLADGFDHYDDRITRDPDAVHRLEAERPARDVVDRAAAWLRDTPRSGPTFLWVHFYDPHAPYAGSYDEEVRAADAQLGRLLREVQASSRTPVVIVAGDHGESLGEHGEVTHGMLVYEAALRVPLIVAGPGIPAARREDPASLVDIAPTLAKLAGITGGHDFAGAHSLLDAPSTEREIYAESVYPRVAGWSPAHALVRDRWKLIVSRGAELYAVSADPAETRNLADSHAATVGAMAARIETLRAPRTGGAPAAAASGAAEKLRALGYVASAPGRFAPDDAPNPADHIAAWGEFEGALADLRARPARAVGRLQKLASAFPDAPAFQSTYARALSQTGSLQAAIAIYRRAVAKWAEDPVLFHELAVTARQAGLAEEALRAETAALALDPSLPSAHNGIGLLMTDAGRHADAAAAFERATRDDPTNAEYWVNLGNARRAAGNTKAAADAYRRASDIEPSSADAANGLGVLLVQQQRAAEAIPLFERALAASPEFAEARLNLAIAYQESGQRERAAAAYRDVLARARPGSRERRAAADLLRSLGR